MYKKTLIGSIIAGAVLIGVSFTSVVGYNSLESNIEVSPLFNIRSSRAIDEKSGDFRCEYVGREEKSILSIPKRHDKIELVQKFIDNIRMIDIKTFNNFVSLIFGGINKQYINDEEIVILLNQLNNKQEKNETVSLLSWKTTCTIDAWFPGCLILKIIMKIVGSIHAFIEWINNIRNSISYILPGCCETWN